uniref:Uncharacterized protein n=1 Tax=Pithovirus LCPAC404 TaxID=2506597 RepID=A0A481ZBW6_9VIRU|nr:MAG: hypothetical protein LCPAC404_00720 [Pithovirus LCPAC404]
MSIKSRSRLSRKAKKLLADSRPSWHNLIKANPIATSLCCESLDKDFSDQYDLSNLKSKTSQLTEKLLFIENIQPGVSIERQISRGFVEFSIPTISLRLVLKELLKHPVLAIVSLHNTKDTKALMSKYNFCHSNINILDDFQRKKYNNVQFHNYVFFGNNTSFVDFRFPSNEIVLIDLPIPTYIAPIMLNSDGSVYKLVDWYSDEIRLPLYCISHNIPTDKLISMVTKLTKIVIVDSQWSNKEQILNTLLDVLHNIEIDNIDIQ